jgi:NAD(P)-dependent dehydrogenase (short-subunit alcohol dehydrogenase family)
VTLPVTTLNATTGMNPGWALVLGASGGIGERVVAQLRGRGVSVAACDRRDGPGLGLADLGLVAELGSPAVWPWVEHLCDRYGPPAIVVNAAGVYDRVALVEREGDSLAEVLASNLSDFAGFLARLLRVTPSFRLVAVGSQAAVFGGTDAVYAASKAGLHALVKSVAANHARDGLRANVVSPGPVETPMASVMGERRSHYEEVIPIGRFTQPEEVASLIVWLCTDAPDAITGAVYDIDGGLTRR